MSRADEAEDEYTEFGRAGPPWRVPMVPTKMPTDEEREADFEKWCASRRGQLALAALKKIGLGL